MIKIKINGVIIRSRLRSTGKNEIYQYLMHYDQDQQVLCYDQNQDQQIICYDQDQDEIP